jgi:hypothetical protein
VLYFSIIAVFIPNCAQRMAATYPPGPEPITATSYEFIVCFYIFKKILFHANHDKAIQKTKNTNVLRDVNKKKNLSK